MQVPDTPPTTALKKCFFIVAVEFKVNSACSETRTGSKTIRVKIGIDFHLF